MGSQHSQGPGLVVHQGDESGPGTPTAAATELAAAGPRAGQRWLVLAPHPDDETLGAGGLLQRVRAAGAAAHVALLTDGENNPWPQRWLERRWRLGATDRARWAGRRRDECGAALRELGLDPGRDLTAFGWEDGHLTAGFCGGPEPFLSRLRALLARVGPSDVVLPAADDRHPDHNLCPVLLALALDGTGLQPRRHAYRVHGRSRGDSLRITLDAVELERKQAALACHASQMALSRGRFAMLAGAIECYDADPFGTALARSTGWPSPVEALLSSFPGRRQWRVVRRAASGRPLGVATIDAVSGNPPAGEYVKLESRRRGLWIYDSEGWQRHPERARQVARS
jgi:LmbE family N-acetylglucosaminyl deacetylase